MSNDAKFWVVRIAVICGVVFDLYAIRRMQSAAYGGDSGGIALWFWLLVTSVVLSIPLVMYYYYLKTRRWDSDASAKKVELETLALIYRQKREERQKNRPRN